MSKTARCSEGDRQKDKKKARRRTRLGADGIADGRSRERAGGGVAVERCAGQVGQSQPQQLPVGRQLVLVPGGRTECGFSITHVIRHAGLCAQFPKSNAGMQLRLKNLLPNRWRRAGMREGRGAHLRASARAIAIDSQTSIAHTTIAVVMVCPVLPTSGNHQPTVGEGRPAHSRFTERIGARRRTGPDGESVCQTRDAAARGTIPAMQSGGCRGQRSPPKQWLARI